MDSHGNRTEVYDDSDNNSDTGYTFTINDKEVSGIDTLNKYKLNSHGGIIQTDIDANADGKTDRIIYTVRDSNGYAIESYNDSDANKTTGLSYTLSDGRKVVGISDYSISTLSPTGFILEYYYESSRGSYRNYDFRNAQNILTTIYKDSDDDQTTGFTRTVDGREVIGIDKIEHLKSDITTGLVYVNRRDNDADGEIDQAFYFLRNDGGQLLVYGRDDGYDGVEKLTFSGLNLKNTAFVENLSYVQDIDFTAWKFEDLNLTDFKNKLATIDLGDTSSSSTVTLNSTVISQIASAELKILGDGNDTVNLKNQSDFTKLDTTKVVSGQTYDQYTTQVDGEIYTLLIDNDIAVTFS